MTHLPDPKILKQQRIYSSLSTAIHSSIDPYNLGNIVKVRFRAGLVLSEVATASIHFQKPHLD